MSRVIASVVALLLASMMHASVFGTIKTIVHDPQHRAVANASVVLRSTTSSWSRKTVTDQAGVAQFLAVPVGEYELAIEAPGFATERRTLTAISDRVQEFHTQLQLATAKEEIQVSAAPAEVAPVASSPLTLVKQSQIAQTPGADRTNSLSFITDFVPGSYVVHDQLHVRGGHQVTWAIDGVPVPNTNIASNVGPQFDPKDADFIEAQRGGFGAEYGDRTYGVFNVVPRSGFEMKKSGELVLSYGSFNQTNDQITFGSHSDRFAYYVSANANRTDYGLETPTSALLHNQAAGAGAFTSITFNPDAKDQLRFVGSVRADYYQVPNDPDQQASGIRDREREQDAFANFTFLRTISQSVLFTVTPFFHFNRAAFEGGPQDPISATNNRASTYAGGQVSVALVKGKHNAKVGLYAFGQHDNTYLALVSGANPESALQQREIVNGQLEAVFLEDQYKPFQWLTLTGGVRWTRFSGQLLETATSPRLGAAIEVPRLRWVLRGTYSRFYQPPPLSTVSGPLLEVAAEQGFAFLPLHGERDEQYDVGMTIPVNGWAFEADYFRTGARNFFDHDALGNSNVFLPLTIDRARIRGFESTVRSPRLFGLADVHVAYSHQMVQGEGGISGGLTDFTPPEEGLFFLDHDQRDTLSAGVRADLAWRAWIAANVNYGSGFLNGDGPDHLPPHTTVDIAVGKTFGENWAAKLTATNLMNRRYYVDLSNTFGGSHYSDPRMIAVQVRYRFHF